MNIENTSELVLAIARILQIGQSANMNEKVALHTMLLSESLYQQLFNILSTELGQEAIFLRCLFNDHVSKHLLKINTPLSQISNNYRLKEPFMRTQSLNAQNVQNVFVTAIKQALIKLNYKVNEFTNHHQLCVLVNEHLKNNNSFEFWSEIRKLVPQKTEIQLREYYQKSFQRHMFWKVFRFKIKSSYAT
ncbi:SANT/Myb_domain [Hexamita inflata]|uniref:SANT/Myb_domain n=1 Tax=Hexamita inflata TaxID=28002 RepID=A0ABP1GV55_9EUKA